METLSEDAYRTLYETKLAERHSAYPISPDLRLGREVKSEPISVADRRAVA